MQTEISSITTAEKPFKYRELKVYASTEWLADNKKKYRQVFDRYETTYIYTELSFYNKLFDETDWEVDIELKCFSLKKGKKELCSLPFKRKVSKFDHIVFIREGWGNKSEGAFWKKGSYYWEAYINGEKVATKYFHTEDAGIELTKNYNPYLEVQSIRLYEGPYDDVNEGERTYYTRFSSEETRYVYAEITFKNINPDKNWQCELITKFYNDARELKGQVVRMQRVEKKDELVKISVGWGANVKGSWRKDNYTAEVVFMDILLGIVPFAVDIDFVEGSRNLFLPMNVPTLALLDADTTPKPLVFEDELVGLDKLIGLQDIKIKVREHAQYIQFLKLRREKGFEEKDGINVHSVFIGNPGTGKTTVAKMMGALYKSMGLLSKGHVHEVDRVDLVGEYIGQTAPKVKDALEKAKGGVLFIDEAYSLARSNDDSKDFGREVIEILVKEMTNVTDMAVIVAGYPKEMKFFLDSNPGLKSRFKLFFEFQDYLPQELMQIADFVCREKQIQLDAQAHHKTHALITEAYRKRDRSFGNARFVYDLIEKAKINLGLRIMANAQPKSFSNSDISLIKQEDIEKLNITKKKNLPAIPIDYPLLDLSIDELNKLIGMTKIKQQIAEMVNLVQYYRETNRDVLGKFYLHTVFVGNPGTGKTTVARILTKIYKALGILERGQMIETDRQGLVAGYVGQTAIKTAERIEEAMGGVLFIDEAYALTSRGGGAHGDFGDEAVQTLLKRMEDNRGEFFIFVAGYPENMDTFLKANPGLASRFDKTLRFDDYTPQDLYEIARYMFDKEGLIIEESAGMYLQTYLSFVHEFRDKYFGNARTVRGVVSEVMKNQSLRLSKLPLDTRTANMTRTIALDDALLLKMDKSELSFSRPSMGFR
jgi:SpoVK/Ycf46/Vps4 family AAA+-type ATPase